MLCYHWALKIKTFRVAVSPGKYSEGFLFAIFYRVPNCPQPVYVNHLKENADVDGSGVLLVHLAGIEPAAPGLGKRKGILDI